MSTVASTTIGLILQLVSTGISEVPALISAIKGLVQANPSMTAEQIVALCQTICQDVMTTTQATDAKLDAVDTAQPASYG
jgi:uncharacterized membrane protein